MKKELLKKIDNAAEIFAELYGENKIEAARQRYAKLINDFTENPDTENIRIFSAPGRTELAGNHTDHNRGKVLAAAIQLDNAAVVQKRNDNVVQFRSAGFPDVNVKLTTANETPDLQPKPEETETTEALVRGIAAELCRQGCPAGGFTANAASDVLPGSGLSSSAAVEMLLCRIFDSLYAEGKRSPLEIAKTGRYAENAYFGKPCGLMDQIASAAGGTVAINFYDESNPEIKQIKFDPAALGYALCVVDTGGSHSNLTADYAAIPTEMKQTASFFGKSVLGQLEKDTVMAHAAEIRKAFGDRALLRSLHFFDENARVDAMTAALTEIENTSAASTKQQAFSDYLNLVNESGESSIELLQNIYSPQNPEAQGVSYALSMTKDFFRKQKLHGAYRVHGGGFAGTIQVYIPLDALNTYQTYIESIFGIGSLTELRIRQKGTTELVF